MSSPAIQGQVVAVNGVVKAIDAQGHERILKAGDIIHPGEHVVLLDGATLSVARDGGEVLNVDGPRELALTDETLQPQVTDKTEAAVAKLAPEAQQVLAALENGQDPLAQLDSAAAGLNGAGAGDEGSHSFVRLMRVSESLNGLQTDTATGTVVTSQSVQADTTSNVAAPISLTIDSISATNDATPTIHGTGIPGLTVIVTNTSGTVIGSAVVGSDGNWFITPTSPLPDGTDTLIATSTNTAGVTATASANAIIDTTPPATPTVTIAEHSDPNGVIGASDLVNGKVEATVKLDATDLAKNGSATIVVNDGGHITTLVVHSDGSVTGTDESVSGSYSNGTVTLSMTPPAQDATVTITATQTDAVGNTSAQGKDSGTLDTVAPSAPTVTIATDANNDGFINKTEQGSASTDTVNIGLPSDAKAGDTLNVTINGVAQAAHVLSSDDISAGKVVLTPTAPTDGATLTVTASITDTAGNTSSTGSSSAQLDLSASISISNDGSGGDHTYNKAESSAVVISGSTGGVETGQTVTITFTDSQGHTATTTATVDDNGNWTAKPANLTGLSDGSISVSATVSDKAGNIATANTDSGSGQPGENLDTTAPSAPTVTIATDTNDDGFINKAEQGSATTETVNIGLPSDAKAGDTLNVSINGVAQAAHVLSSDDISAGKVVLTPAAPAEGGTLTVAATITDVAGNTSAQGSDSATLDTTAPSAPTVTIATDTNDDGFINKAEQGSATTETVNIGLPSDAKAGDTLNVSINGVAQAAHVLSSDDISAGKVVLTPAAPAEGGTLTVAATITDVAGNTSAQGSDSATLDTTAPSAPTVVIATDTNDDGFINKAEQGSATTETVNIGLPSDAKAGDTLNVSINGVAQAAHVLSSDDISAGKVVLTPAAPAEGGTLTVAATITDVAGNTSAQGSDSAQLDTVAPSAPTVTIASDTNDDGFINKAEQGSATTETVNIGLPSDAKAGDTLNVSINGVAQAAHVLSSDDITAGKVVLTPAAPAEGGTLTVAATITDVAGNTSAQGSDSAQLDTVAPSAPTVTIATDTNDDGFINKAEQGSATTETVNIGLPSDAKAGDTLNVSINGVAQAAHVLSSDDISAGKVVLTPAAPAEGGTLTVAATITDVAGNTSAQGSDSATLDTTAPSAPTVTIATDTNDDGFINKAEQGSATTETVNIGLPSDAKAGDTLNVSINGVAQAAHVLSSDDISAGKVVLTPAAPAEGGTLTVAATITDVAGNTSAQGSDSATLDTTAPSAPTVVIATDTNDDGFINKAEQGSATTETVNIGLPSDAKAGDTLNVSINGVAQAAHVLSSDDISAGKVVLTPAAPAEGGTLTVAATITDVAGNTSAQGSDSAQLDTVAPSAPTVTIASDTNDDGFINKAEQGSATTETVNIGLPSDAKAGDTLNVSINGVAQAAHVLSSDDITAGKVVLTPAAPAEGGTLTVAATITDVAGNTSAQGSDSAQLDTVAPSAPTVTIATDTNDDGFINKAEQGSATTETVNIGLPSDAKAGDTLNVSINGVAQAAHVLSSDDITAGKVVLTPAAPAEGGTLTVAATITDVAGNTSAQGSDSAQLDTVAPSAPTVTIATDTNDDGFINKAEQGSATTETVNIGLPSDAKAGDTLNVSINGVAQAAHVLSSDDISAGKVVLTPAAPAEGGTLTVAATITDVAGNTSAQGSDSAQLDTVAPSAPTVTIASDTNDDGFINKAEQGSATTETVNIGLPSDAKAGDTLNVSINGVAQAAHVLSSDDITAGKVVLTPAAPAEGGTLTVAATITDVAGNTSAQGSDSAQLDTVAPSAPTVTIASDTNDDGFINKAEQGSATTETVNIGLPSDAKAGDTLNVSINGVAQAAHVLSSDDISAGKVVLTPAAPAEGGTLTVAATITDVAGNTSAQGSDSAQLDTVAPSAPTVTIATDTNDDGFINKAEQGSATTETVNIGLPSDAKAGDTLNVSINGVAQAAHVLSSDDITAGKVVLTPAAPAEGGTLTVAATITDVAGNTSAQGSDSAQLDTVAPSAPTVTIASDTNDDGFINKAEQGSATTETVNIGLPSDAKAGDTLNVSINGVAQAAHVLSSDDISAGKVVLTPAAPAEGGTLTVAATITDVAGNTSAQGSDSAQLDTVAPSAPTVTIATDTNDDGFINKAEQGSATTETVNIGLPSDAKAGDTLNVSINGVAQAAHVLSSDDITAGKVVLTPAAPAEGGTLTVAATITDVAGNTSAQGSDSAQLDTVAPSAPTVTIATDTNDDGFINKAEQGSATTETVNIGLPSDAKAGDTLNVSINGVAQAAHVLSSDDITAGKVVLTPAAPAEGGTLTVAATITDVAGNTSAQGSDSAQLDTVAPSAPTVTIASDTNDDGFINKAEQGSATTETVNIGLPSDAKAGDTLNVSINGVAQAAHVLSSDDISAGKVVLTPAAPAEGGTLTVAATITDVAGNTSAQGSDSAQLDTVAPSAPTVTIATDTNDDGFINKAEQGSATTETVNIGLPSDAKAGDTLNVSINGVAQAAHVLSSDDITAGKVVLTPAAPAEGGTLTVAATITDVAGNTSAQGSDSAQLDTVAPSAPTVTIATDTNDDGFINKAEQGSATTETVNIGLPSDAKAGDTLNVSINGVAQAAHVLSSDDITAGKVVLTPAAPAEGGTLTVAATITDVAGNTSAQGSDSAQLDTVAPSAPTVTIASDTNDDGFINKAEQGSATTETVNIGLPSDAKAGDTLNVSINGVAQAAHVLSSDDITAGKVVLTPAAPAEGGTLTVAATITDVAGNTSAQGSDSAQLDTVAPSAPTVTIATDTNDDGFINKAEQGSATTETVNIGLPSDAKAGDTLNVSINGVAQAAHVLSSDDITAGKVVLTPAAPAEGGTLTVAATITDVAGNTSAQGSDSAQLDTVAPSAPTVTIASDTNDDGFINKAEQGSATTETVNIGLPSDAKAGDTLNVSINGVAQAAHVLSSDDITAGKVVLTPAAPAEGGTLTVAATITDVAGNTSAQGSDSAQLDTVAPSAPTVTIATDTNDDGFINKAEQGSATTETVNIGLPSDAKAGDTLNVSINGVAQAAHVLSSDDITAGKVVLTPAAPAEGGTLTVAATITDVAGNTSAQGSDSATLDTTAPDTPVVSILPNGLTSNYYGLNDSVITGSTPLSQVLSDIASHSPTATFVADALSFGVANSVSGNLGASGNLANFLGSNASNVQYASTYGSTSQAIISMNGVFAAASGTYKLSVLADDGYQIIVDGVTVATRNQNQSPTGTDFTLTLGATAGNLHTIQIVYWDQGGQAVFQSTLTPAGSTTASVISLVSSNTMTASVTLDAKDQAELNHSGTVHITSSTGTDVTLHLNSSNQLVDGNGLVYSYQNGVIYLPVATPSLGTTLTVNATVTDLAGNTSGVGSDSYHLPTTPPVVITTDSNHDGYLSGSETSNGTATLQSTVTLDKSLISAGGSANLTVTDNGVVTKLVVNHDGSITGAANGVTASYNASTGVVTLNMPEPGDGKSVSISATQTDTHGNVSTTGAASAIEDITAPSAPTVTIATDANNDGYINKAEQGSATTETVNIGLPSNAKAGDTLNVTINDVVQTGHVLTAAEITAGKVVLTPAAPADGGTLTVKAYITDLAGNVSASASDSAKIDLTAPTIAIATTLAGDDVINAAEHNKSLLVSGSTSGVEDDQKVDVVLNNVHYSATVSGNSWSVTVPASDVAKLADGNITVTANVSDAAGNAATPASHALTVDTTLPTINLVSNITTSQLFNTTWESTNQTTSTTKAEGWTLVTSNDVAPGGINGFEIWTTSDSMSTASGSTITPNSSTGAGNTHWLELNNSTSDIIQTLGITRTVTTVAGAEYQLSMDFAGRPGYSTDVSKIGIYVDGKLVAEYSATSGSTLDWRNISFDFTGTGGNQVITILTDTPASAVDASGRGAMVDNIVLTQGGFQASDAATTTIALSSLMTASHPVAVGSETLTLNISGLTSAEGSPSLVLHGTTYTPDASGNLTVTGLSLSDLQSGSLQLSGSYHGQVSFNATVTAIESNGNTATSSTVPVSFLVGAGNEVHGSAGTDYLYAGSTATLLHGGAGNDTMTSGSTGVDTFKWVLGDQGTVATPAVDTIINFKTAAVSNGGDKLDLRDLLVGESHSGTDVGNLGNYLHFTTSTSKGVTSTVIHVSETGNLATHETQQIVLQNVDLTHSGNTLLSDSQILHNLLGSGKLITD